MFCEKKDVSGIKTALHAEGCPKGENKFDDLNKLIKLDPIQNRIAVRNGAEKNSSVDFLILLSANKVVLVEAKYNARSCSSIKREEIEGKVRSSKAIITLDFGYFFHPSVYMLFTKSVIVPSRRNELKKKFRNSPRYEFLNTEEFKALFA